MPGSARNERPPHGHRFFVHLCGNKESPSDPHRRTGFLPQISSMHIYFADGQTAPQPICAFACMGQPLAGASAAGDFSAAFGQFAGLSSQASATGHSAQQPGFPSVGHSSLSGHSSQQAVFGQSAGLISHDFAAMGHATAAGAVAGQAASAAPHACFAEVPRSANCCTAMTAPTHRSTNKTTKIRRITLLL